MRPPWAAHGFVGAFAVNHGCGARPINPRLCRGTQRGLTFAAVVFQAFTLTGVLFISPPLTKGGEGGFSFRTGLYDSGVLNPPQSPFVKGGGEECGRLGRRTVLSALLPLTTAEGLTR
jgi:hypothetical protein